MKKKKSAKHECYNEISPRKEIPPKSQHPMTSYVLLNKIPSISAIQISWN